MSKFRLGVVLVFFLAGPLLTFFPAGAEAGEKPAVSLEQAIRTVRECFTIPDEFTRFTSSYTSGQDQRAWILNWSAPEEPGGSFSARVDAQTGEILSMNTWRPEGAPSRDRRSLPFPRLRPARRPRRF